MQNELADLDSQMNQVKSENIPITFDLGVKILELSQVAYSLYVKQKIEEKRDFVNKFYSNCAFDGVSLCPTYRSPSTYSPKGLLVIIGFP